MNHTDTQPSLHALQRWMQWMIAEPSGVELALAGTNRSLAAEEPEPRCLGWIDENPGASREQRLTVYADAFLLRIVDVLKADFKALFLLLGESPFFQLVSDYLERFPSTSPNIAEIGQHLPEYLQTYAPLLDRPYLSELALLEWQVHESFFANDLPPFDFSALAGLPESALANARFELDPSVRLIQTRWPIYGIWKHAQKTEEPISPLSTKMRRQFLLVFRNEQGQSLTTRISQAQFAVLERLRLGSPLNDVTGLLYESCGEQAAKYIQNWFQRWVGEGVIRKVVIS